MEDQYVLFTYCTSFVLGWFTGMYLRERNEKAILQDSRGYRLFFADSHYADEEIQKSFGIPYQDDGTTLCFFEEVETMNGDWKVTKINVSDFTRNKILYGKIYDPILEMSYPFEIEHKNAINYKALSQLPDEEEENDQVPLIAVMNSQFTVL